MTDAITKPPMQKAPMRGTWARLLAVAGPGIVVMLADTDAGSVITAAQSGAEFGYKLLLFQLILVPILYMVQELTVRLGVVTGKGHAELITQHFGRFWAWVSVAALIVACLGAVLSELSGLAGAGALFGVPKIVTMALVVGLLIAMAITGSYLTIERIAIAVGLFELLFIYVAWQAQPAGAELARGLFDMPLGNSKYLLLISANIGAVIMPWMVFYQQSSVVEKGLTTADMPAARLDTAIGALITQLIMAAVLVATAATIGKAGANAPLDTVEQIAGALTPFLGQATGRIIFALAISGSAVVATIVVTLTAARTIGEVLGVPHKLEAPPREARWFYGVYALTLLAGAAIVTSGADLVSISVGVQVLNALLLPLVLGFLYLLAVRLPEPWRLQGWYSMVVAVVMGVTAVFGVYAAVMGLMGG